MLNELKTVMLLQLVAV